MEGREQWAFALEEWHSIPVGVLRGADDRLVCVVFYPEQPEHRVDVERILGTNAEAMQAAKRLPLAELKQLRADHSPPPPCPVCGTARIPQFGHWVCPEAPHHPGNSRSQHYTLGYSSHHPTDPRALAAATELLERRALAQSTAPTEAEIRSEERQRCLAAVEGVISPFGDSYIIRRGAIDAIRALDAADGGRASE